MTTRDAPPWLLSSWTRSCTEAGATAPEAEVRATGERLVDRWDEPGRHYHNLRHLADVLQRVDELAEETHEPDLVRLGTWYHGAVFDAADRAAYAHRGGEDESASAALALAELTTLGLPERAARRVAELVTALVHHRPRPGDADAAVLVDADLAILAAEPQRYKQYRQDVRAEYAHLPLRDYLTARIAIVGKLLGRPALFFSPGAASWEEPARQNLTAELHRLTKELAALDAAAEG